jgi:hypothetical protein
MKKRLIHPSKFIVSSLLICFILLFIIGLFLPGEKIPEKKVPCYDSNDNEFIDATCIEGTIVQAHILVSVGLILTVITMMCELFLILSIEENSNLFGFEVKE